VLRRLHDCNFFVPVFTELYAAKIADDALATSAVAAELNLACELAEGGYVAFLGVWRSGDPAHAPLDEDNTFDMREEAPWGRDDVFPAAVFPAAVGGGPAAPGVPAPGRPPDPRTGPGRSRTRRRGGASRRRRRAAGRRGGARAGRASPPAGS
jgi:hypothetical protein